MPERIQLRRTKGWRMPANTVKVDRTTIYGNPFRVGEDPSKLGNLWWALPSEFRAAFTRDRYPWPVRDAAEAVACFRELAYSQSQHAALVSIANEDLRGKNLACWCKIGAPCHADVLLNLANSRATPARERLSAVDPIAPQAPTAADSDVFSGGA